MSPLERLKDPPFVYSTPIIRLDECRNLGKVSVNLGGKSNELVVGGRL